MKPSRFTSIVFLISISFVLLSGSLLAKKKGKVPRKVSKSYILLANYLTENSKSDQEKVDTIYSWITHNIAYDYKKLEENSCFEYETVDNTLKSKKALCADYSNLMTFMLREIGIRAEIVEGYTRTENWNDTMNLTRTSHAWVAAEVDDDWQMFDPTWDAGYIGREPVIYKKPKLKVGKADTKKEKLKKIEYKNKQKLKKYDEKVKNGPQYKGKIKFVFDPKKEWFMAPKDSFLISHLPAVEFWQLRANPITIEDFVQPKNQVIGTIMDKPTKGTNFDQEIENHLSLNLLERMIDVGDLGFEFNPDNAGIKALSYFNYLSILNNKELKKYFKDAPEELNKPIYRHMLQYVDTVEKYSRIDVDNQKSNYKSEKKWLKSTYKSTKISGKSISKKAALGNKSHNKLMSLIDKTDERILTDKVKLETMAAKINEKHPEARDGEYGELDLKPVKSWNDSIDLVSHQLDSLISTVEEDQENSSLEGIYNGVQWVEHYMRVSSEYIGQNNFGLNRFIMSMDSMTINKLDTLNYFYSIITEQEVIDKTAMNLLKKTKAYIKKSKAETKILEQQGKIISSKRYDAYLHSLLLKDITKVYELFQISKRHHEWIKRNSDFIDTYWFKISKLVDQQEGLNDEKNTFMSEQYQHNFNRDKDLYALMKKSVKSWKAYFNHKIEED